MHALESSAFEPFSCFGALDSFYSCLCVCVLACVFSESLACYVSYELDLVSCLLFGGHLKILNFIICELSFGIPEYLLDLGLLCMISCGWLSLAAPISFKRLFLMRTCTHTPTRSQLYTLVSTPFVEIEFSLRDFNF